MLVWNAKKVTYEFDSPEYTAEERRLAVTVVGLKFDIGMWMNVTCRNCDCAVVATYTKCNDITRNLVKKYLDS